MSLPASFFFRRYRSWLAMIGPTIQPLGEIKENQQLYQEQIADLIAGLVGEKFVPAFVGR